MPLVLAFGHANAAGSEPREGHFRAPDVPLNAAATSDAPASEPGFYQTSEYLIGSVAVGLILPESDGSIDAELNDWTPEQHQRVLDKVTEGLAWWSRQAPEARLTFFIDDHATNPIPTGYEPIARPQHEEGLWIGDTLSKLGYVGGSYWNRVRHYVKDLRKAYRTDWAFALFVVNSDGDADAAFADGYFAYAYIGGPFFVMTYDNAGYGIDQLDAVAAHETGHVFRALDQYASANIACTARSGYLGVETQNSQRPGCTSDVPSIMRGGTHPYAIDAIDPYARGQVGWRDSDGDGIFDPTDTIPTLTVDSATQANGAWQYSGHAFDTPYPSPLLPATTINDVLVEYRVDGGAWAPAQPADGRFDSPDESFTLTLNLATSGNHRVTLRTRNTAGNMSETATFIAVVPDPVDGGLDTWLEPSAGDPAAGTGTAAMAGIASSFNVDGTPGAAIARVEYRIDGGEWRLAQPQDGAFDGVEEGFSIPLDVPGDNRLLEARAIDVTGKTEQKLAALQISIGYYVFLPILQR